MSLPAAVGLWTDCAAFDLPEELEVLVAQALSTQRKAKVSYEALQVSRFVVCALLIHTMHYNSMWLVDRYVGRRGDGNRK